SMTPVNASDDPIEKNALKRNGAPNASLLGYQVSGESSPSWSDRRSIESATRAGSTAPDAARTSVNTESDDPEPSKTSARYAVFPERQLTAEPGSCRPPNEDPKCV